MGILPDLTTETFRNSLPRSTAMSGAAWEQLRCASITADNNRVLSHPALPLLLAGMLDTCAEEVAKSCRSSIRSTTLIAFLSSAALNGSVCVLSARRLSAKRGVQSENFVKLG